MKKDWLSTLFSLFFELTSEPNFPLPGIWVHLLMLFHFSQTLSPLFKLHFSQFTGVSNIFFPGFIFYSNFANILTYTQNPNLFLLVYSLTIAILLYPLVLLLTALLMKRLLKTKITPNHLSIQACRLLLVIFNWVLIIPSLETLMNPFDCDWYTFSMPCQTIGAIYIVFSVISIFWAVVLCFLLSYIRKDFYFSANGIEFQ